MRIRYERKGEHLEVRLVDGYKVLEVQQFKVNSDEDNDRLCEYLFEKLGFDYRKYMYRKSMEWQ